ncbi:uncharacterized protein LOC113771070 [Coffea eugenioides]|uniref:uncharacterized protein LOC113771070 n=1 Tax=Coffea eugenioides TaxID=49369 RepID=UPI000F608AF7|nr:uncharacterized protein LOC113771070 [Coffea eugenioides]
MEGTGQRLSRFYSRYGLGPAPSAPVFTGPVRKWKRKWVPSEPNKDNAVSGKRGHQHQEQDAPSLLLCRWTPLNSSGESSEPSKRKFRYTPVIAFEEKKKEAVERLDDDAARIEKNQSRADVIMTIDMPFEKPHFNDNFVEEMKEPGEDHAYFENLDLQL